MGLKILHSADWHMDAPFTSFVGEQRDFLRREQRKIPGRIVEICSREKCDMVLLAGDVFDGIPAPETVELVRRALEDCGVPVFVSPGNHDFCGIGSPWLEEQWPENVTVFTGGLESVAVPRLDCRVYGAGYRSMDCEPLLENFQAEGTERFQIAVLHADPVTARSPYCPVTMGQVRDSKLHYLALGHIHKAGIFRSGGTLCAWPGCPMGRGWDETGEKGICIISLEDDPQAQFAPLDTPRFYDLEADISDGVQEALDSILPAGGSHDFFRITLTGQADVDMDTIRRQYAALPNLFFRDTTLPEADLWAQAGEDSFRGVYFALLRQQAEQDPQAVLAAQISQKILSGREVRLP